MISSTISNFIFSHKKEVYSTTVHEPNYNTITTLQQRPIKQSMDVWSWICELPNSDEWTKSDSPPVYELACSKPSQDGTTQSIQLRAERTAESNSDAVVTFSLYLHGFHPSTAGKTLWVSDACHLSSDKPFLPLILQLLQEVLCRSPIVQDSTCPRSQVQELKSDPVMWVMDSHSPESFSGFFNLVFLTRLFWLCAWDAPADVGSLYFQLLLAPNLEALSCRHALVLKSFFISVGADMELCFMRTLSYMLAKWFLLREVSVGLQLLTPVPRGFSYAMEAHGFWVLKGYVPIRAMTPTSLKDEKNGYRIIEAKESVLRYALAHQQLEAVIQLEYSVGFYEGYIQVNARVDNIRLHVEKLGFNKNKNGDEEYAHEKYFPSRVRVWVGPEVGSNYVVGLSLGRSTDNIEREVEMQKIVKGSFGKSKVPKVKTVMRTSMRSKIKNWKLDHDVEGNTGIFDAVLYDNITGSEIATWKPSSDDDTIPGPGGGFRKRYSRANRAFTKSGSLVFARDEFGGEVEWRLNKEMEGSVLKWRIGGEVWLSYWPSDIKSSYFETRCVEWCDEVDLPLINPVK